MEKHKLLTLVKKTGRSFKNQNPTGIYREVLNNTHYESLSHVLNAKDLVIYSLLVPRFNMDSDIDEDYDRIENNMFTIELVEIYNSEPEVECPECGGHGSENCDNCDGTGEVECGVCDGSGEEDCRYCGGSGMDEDAGEECDMCEGDGKQTCEHCNGSGYESCQYCGGDGEVGCDSCDSTGNIYSDEQVEIQNLDYISWSGRWKDYFFRAKPDEQLDEEDTKNFGFNSQTILLGMFVEISEEYLEYENGDVLLYVAKDTKDLNLKKTNQRIHT